MEVLTDRENSHAYDLAAESPEDTGVSGRKKMFRLHWYSRTGR